jgi:hypothetical protein
LNLFPLGQCRAPDVPERIRADHLGAVFFNARVALGKNPAMPAMARIGVSQNVSGNGG